MRYALADRLNKTLAEIDDMSVEEFMGWVAYCRIEKEGFRR